MSVNFKPITGSQVRILVKPIPTETITPGGIIIPDTAKEKPQRGKIAAVGNNIKDEVAIVKEGDEVFYGKFSGTEFKFENEDYLIMRESDLFGIVG